MILSLWISFALLILGLTGGALAQPQGRPARPPGMLAPLVGAPAADFELQSLDGSAVRLSNYIGKIFVLELGACT